MEKVGDTETKTGTTTKVTAVIATAALCIASLTALFVVLTPRTVTVTDPGQTIWNNRTEWHNTTVWHNQTFYVNRTNSSGSGDGNWTGHDSGNCPKVPDWAPAWGVRARCGLPPASGHNPGQTKERNHDKGNGGD